MKQLHLLNGQGTAHNFTLSGDYLVWNEALACGNTLYEIASEKFYNTRRQFFKSQYSNLPLREPVENSDKQYDTLVIQEIKKLKNASQYNEITLWFEFDWFCQINMMAALSWFWQQQIALDHIYLVCINDHPAIDNFRGLGQLKPEHFAPLFSQRKKLTAQNIAFADKVWAAYCGHDMLALSQLISHTPEAFPYLATAFKYFQQLFPDQQSGLNIIEQQMLDIAQRQTLENKHQWIGQILRKGTPYLGFGDLQYYDSLQRMKPLWQENDTIELTELGKQVASHQQNFLAVQPQKFALGGVFNTDYCWQNEQQRLVKI